MNTQLALTILSLAVAAAVVFVFIASVVRGKCVPMKPLRPTLLLMAIPLLLVALMATESTFNWLGELVPDTEWWDGATTMGVIVAVIGFLTLMVSGYVTAMNNASQDAPDPGPDHLTQAITALVTITERFVSEDEVTPRAPDDNEVS